MMVGTLIALMVNIGATIFSVWLIRKNLFSPYGRGVTWVDLTMFEVNFGCVIFNSIRLIGALV